MSSVGILGSHFAGDFFLGIDIMVTSMMVNFLLMCITLVGDWQSQSFDGQRNKNIKNSFIRNLIGILGSIVLLFFLVIHTWKDITTEVGVWYFHSTPIWLIVMAFASIIFYIKLKK
jgi:basic amino acid/polyamine antiporter, APA family